MITENAARLSIIYRKCQGLSLYAPNTHCSKNHFFFGRIGSPAIFKKSRAYPREKGRDATSWRRLPRLPGAPQARESPPHASTGFATRIQAAPRASPARFDPETAANGRKMAEDENVKVFCRVRPPNEREGGAVARAKQCVTVSADPQQQTLVLQSKHAAGARTFTFDRVFGDRSTQTDVFQVVGAPITRACLDGYNGTIFAYGQTGSGKTFTMQGPDDVIDAETRSLSDDELALRGLVPRVFDFLFENENATSGGNQGALRIEHTFSCSFLEIYNERVYDLLDGGSARDDGGLQLRENGRRGVVVEGLVESVVTGARQAAELMTVGARNRRVGQTTMNRESSRSHSVFILQIQSKEISEGGTKTRTSRFNLVDLAGSERQRSTGAAGERLREAGNINRSLSALGKVIMGLVDQASGKSRHVHYRDSKLTFLLKDSLGGNSKTFMIATISPAEDSSFETLSTLQFAQRAKRIRNNAIINEDTSGNTMYLQEEIQRLKRELDRSRASNQHLHGSRLLTSQEFLPLEQQLSEEDDLAVGSRIRRLEEALAMMSEKTDQQSRSCDRLLLRESHLETLCEELKRNVLHLKMLLRLRQGDPTASEYVPSVDAVEWRIKYEELEDEFNRLQDELARYEAPTGGLDTPQSEVERINILLMALTRQLSLAIRDKHELQDQLDKKASNGSDMDADEIADGTFDFSARLEESLKQQAGDYESRLSSLKCEAQILEEKAVEASLEVLTMKQREAAYKIQLSEANAVLADTKSALSASEDECKLARAQTLAHKQEIDNLTLQMERVNESVRLEFDQQLLDQDLTNKTLTSKVAQLEHDVAQMTITTQKLQAQYADAEAQLVDKEKEVTTLSTRLDEKYTESKRLIDNLAQVKTESRIRDAELTAKLEQRAALASEKEKELIVAAERIDQLESILKERSQSIDQLSSELKNTKQSVTKTLDEKITFEKKVSHLDDLLLETNQKLQSLARELEESKTRHAATIEQRQKLERELKQSKEREDELSVSTSKLTRHLEATERKLGEAAQSSATLQLALEEKSRAMTQFERAHAKLQDEHAKTTTVLMDAERSILKLKQDTAESKRAYDNHIAALSSKADAEKKELTVTFTQQLHMKDNTISELRADSQNYQKLVGELEVTVGDLRARNEGVEGEFKAFKEDAIKRLSEQVNKFAEEKAELERKLDQTTELSSKYQHQLESERSEFLAQQKQCESDRLELERVSFKANEQLKAKVDQLELDLTQQTSALKAELQTGNTLQDQAASLASDLKRKSLALQDAHTKLHIAEEDLVTSKAASDGRIESLVSEAAELRDTIARISSREDKLKTKLESTLSQNKVLEIDNHNLTAKLDEALQSHQRKLNSMTMEAETLVKELQDQLDKETAARNHAESALSTLEKKLHATSEEAKIKLAAKMQTISEYTAAANNLERAAATMSKELADEKEVHTKLDGELKRLQVAHKTLRSEHDSAVAKWSSERQKLVQGAKSKSEELQSRSKQVVELEDAIKKAERTSREVLAEKDRSGKEFEGELKRVKQMLESALAENKRVKGQLDKQAELKALEASLSRRSAETKSSESAVQAKMQQLERVKLAMTQTEDELKQLRIESKSSKQKIQRLEVLNRQSESERARIETEANKLREKLKNITEENHKLVSHHNARQKIQYHIKVKEQNNQLLEQVRCLSEKNVKIKRMNEKLRLMLKENVPLNGDPSSASSDHERTKPASVPSSSPPATTTARASSALASSARSRSTVFPSSTLSKSPKPSKKRPRTRDDN